MKGDAIMKDVIGVIFSNMHEHKVRQLTVNRCMGSLPVGGRYRLIDFVLSGFSNAGILNTAIIAKSNYRSLLDHLGNGREWDLARKRGGLLLLPPAALSDNGALYTSRVEALAGIMGVIKDSPAEYVLSADCDIMANIDYNAFINAHKQSGADITVMYKRRFLEGKHNRNVSTFNINDSGRVTDMYVNPETVGEQNEFLNIVIFSKDLLEYLIRDCISRNTLFYERDMLQANINKFNISAYEYKEYAARFDSVQTYYDSNLELLDDNVRSSLFNPDRPIYTRVYDEAPVRYGLQAHVENSLLADGCVIEGEVENCLLFRGVTVAKGAKVKDSILMNGTYVGPYANLQNVITDKRVSVRDNRDLMGAATYPMYITKGSIV